MRGSYPPGLPILNDYGQFMSAVTSFIKKNTSINEPMIMVNPDRRMTATQDVLQYFWMIGEFRYL